MMNQSSENLGNPMDFIPNQLMPAGNDKTVLPSLEDDVFSHSSFPMSLPSTTANEDKFHQNAVNSMTEHSEEAAGTIRVPSGSGYRIMTPFPWRLHEMLEEIETKKMSSIVSWLPGGRAFQVHSPEKFSEVVIPMFFRHTRYKSFQRQLYLYGFRSIEMNSISKGAYFHPYFIKGDRSLCRQIVRPKSAGTTPSRSRSSGSGSRKKKSEVARKVGPQCQKPSVSNKRGGTTRNGDDSRGGMTKEAIIDGGLATLPLGTASCQSQRTQIRHALNLRILASNAAQSVPAFLSLVQTNSLEENFVTPAQKNGTTSLLQNLQLALLGKPLPLTSRPSKAGEGDLNMIFDPANKLSMNKVQGKAVGPILTMSTGGMSLLNYDRTALDILHGQRIASVSQNGSPSTVQKLEPFSDDIITLFGRTSSNM